MLGEALGGKFPIHHVGSTAVIGIDGKNIVDILISAKTPSDIADIQKQLVAVGYFPSWEPSRRDNYVFMASRREETGAGDAHIHIALEGTEVHDDFLTLRDYLRLNDDEAANYSKAKYTCAEKAKGDRSMYKQYKSEYVSNLLRRARTWRRNNTNIK